MPFSRMILPSVTRLSVCGTAALCASLFFAGCNAGSFQQSAADGPVIQGVSLQGSTFGGQQPVNGATIQLYAVGKSGVASAATPLISSTVKTNSTGGFSITGDYTCPTGAQVYLVATGGDPGVGTTNSQLALMAALGSCGSLSASTFTRVNEVTTVASVAALLGYMTDITKVGSASGDSGLTTAFSRVALLANNTTGEVAPATQTQWNYTTQPTNLVTLADSVAACINSSGGAAGTSTTCGSLLTDATPPGGTAPTNTVAAIVDILNNPTHNVAAIYDLAGPTSPFQPTLSAAPANWSLGLYAPAPAVSFSGYTATMTVASPAVQIRYTLDGSTPTTSSTLYTAPVAVPIAAGATVTVNAIGVDAKNVTSSVSSQSVQRPAVPAPTISVNGTTVTITAPSPATQIRYTLDGSTPTTTSTLYSGAFNVNPGAGLSVTVNAIAVDSLGSTGSVSSASVQGPAVPVPMITATLISSNQDGTNVYKVTITVASPATQIQYAVLVGAPYITYMQYTGPFTVTLGAGEDAAVQAYGVTAQGGTSSTTSVMISGGAGSGGGCIVKAPGKTTKGLKPQINC